MLSRRDAIPLRQNLPTSVASYSSTPNLLSDWNFCPAIPINSSTSVNLHAATERERKAFRLPEKIDLPPMRNKRELFF